MRNPAPVAMRLWVAAIAIGVPLGAELKLGATEATELKLSSATDGAAAALREEGLELGYNLDHAAAVDAFKAAARLDPNDAIAHRLHAAALWVSLLFDQGAITVDDYLGQARADLARTPPPSATDAAFHEALDRAVALSEQRLRDRPSDVDARYQLGAALGCLATYTATIQGRVTGSFGTARRAYREHERVLELDAARKDAGLIVGLYRYAVGALPMPLRLMARLAGFGGGRESGLRLVEEAARHPSDVQPNALFTLVVLYNRESRYDDALRIIGGLQQRFPRNRLLWLEAGHTALRARRPAVARRILEEGLDRLAHDPRPRARGEEARWRYAYGTALVALADVRGAGTQLRTALPAATRDWVRGRIHTELGKLADLSADRTTALAEYGLADRLCRQDHDAECSREAKALMRATR